MVQRSKKFGQCPPSPPLIRAMPERKHFFSGGVPLHKPFLCPSVKMKPEIWWNLFHATIMVIEAGTLLTKLLFKITQLIWQLTQGCLAVPYAICLSVPCQGCIYVPYAYLCRIPICAIRNAYLCHIHSLLMWSFFAWNSVGKIWIDCFDCYSCSDCWSNQMLILSSAYCSEN